MNCSVFRVSSDMELIMLPTPGDVISAKDPSTKIHNGFLN